MKTQVSILVEKESVVSKMSSMNIWNIGKKPGVCIYIDSEEADPVFLEQREEPYLFELAPGNHAILFKDSKEAGKKLSNGIVKGAVKLTAGLAVGALSMGMGGSFTSAFSTVLGMKAGEKSIQDGFAAFNLQEGELFKLSCRPTHKGIVKVKEIK